MNAQEVFETVAKHLFKQGRQSMVETGADDPRFSKQCVYRTKGGLTCAVGCLIPKKTYHVSMEGGGIETLLSRFPDVLGDLKEHQELLACLQEAHDIGANWTSTEVMRSVLRGIAKGFGLDAAFLDTLSFKRR